MVMTMNEILAQYTDDLTTYYDLYANQLNLLFKDGLSNEDYLQTGRQLQSIAGGLGARIGKAGQRAKRQFVFNELVTAKNQGADLTFHKVQTIAQATTGRHFNNNEVHKNFSTEGRTARLIDRNTMTEEETQALIDAIQPKLNALVVLLAEKREKHAQYWQSSFKRKQIYRRLQKAQQSFKF